MVVSTMGSAAPWSEISGMELDFPSVGSAMGHAADFAMGLALAKPDFKVWVLNGDGSMLMNLGTLVTICQTPPPNLVLFVLQNNTFEVTGNQPIPGAGTISFPDLARASGFEFVYEFEKVAALRGELGRALEAPGPLFICLHIVPGNEPAPKLDCLLRGPVAGLRKALSRRHE
jgi:thiamine pyrophosphate-dependent acetolactate synthase large subunit-like protein